MQDLDDPFALPSTSRVSHRGELITGGRYRLPNRDGTHHKGGWQRVTNLVSAFSDQYGLRMWEIAQALKGIALSPTLYAELLAADLPGMDKETLREWAEQWLEHAKDVAGGNAGAKFGIQRHAAVESYHAGLPVGHMDAGTRRHLFLYGAALQRNELRALDGMQERRVLIESLEAVGTLDNVLEDLRTGLLHIGDLKTQRKFHTWLEIAGQFACYAHADAMWDAVEGRWVDMPTVDLSVAFALWMPRETEDGEPRVDVWEIDIAQGWEVAQEAKRVVDLRSRAKSARAPWGRLRPAPPVTLTEQYAARFAAVETISEGRALVQECQDRGIWSMELADVAKLALERISGQRHGYGYLTVGR